MPKRSRSPKKSFYTVLTILSRIFDPPVLVALLTILAGIISDLNREDIFVFLIFLPLFFGIPLGYFLHKLKTHQVSNWDITKRKERIGPLLALLAFLLFDIVIVSLLDNPFLLNLFVLYFLWVMGFFLVTLVWKISAHSGIVTLAAALLVYWFGWELWPVFIAVPLVCWVRVMRKDHTILQVTAGVLYSLFTMQLWLVLLPQ